VTNGGIEHIATWFIGFRLKGELEVIMVVDGIFTEEVYGFTVPFDSVYCFLARIRLGTFATAPKNVNFGAKFNAQVNSAHGFLQRIGAHFRIIGGKGAILKNRISEQVGGCHGNHQTGILQGFMEVFLDRFRFSLGGVNGDEVIIMEVYAISANLCQQVNQFRRRLCLTYRTAKGITSDRTNCPESKSKLVFGFRGKVSHCCAPFELIIFFFEEGD